MNELEQYVTFYQVTGPVRTLEEMPALAFSRNFRHSSYITETLIRAAVGSVPKTLSDDALTSHFYVGAFNLRSSEPIESMRGVLTPGALGKARFYFDEGHKEQAMVLDLYAIYGGEEEGGFRYTIGFAFFTGRPAWATGIRLGTLGKYLEAIAREVMTQCQLGGVITTVDFRIAGNYSIYELTLAQAPITTKELEDLTRTVVGREKIEPNWPLIIAGSLTAALLLALILRRV